ncbi:caffeic acid 3-O-methyltransferase [Iris pallida]|uniref:Caffeic acid 3-O-methyltransferase n=1 Tax=Iris pallida TaxID=29817 RepID=A0AAX6EVV0_IRIPA|nr:caffeic acid 3-O-methyltransferase [Iris pallida]
MASSQRDPNSRAKPTSEARLAMMELSNMISVPMALHAVVKLGVAEALSLSPRPLSAAEILPLLCPPPPPSSSPINLQRLLRLLSSHGVFSEETDADTGRRLYALTDVGRTLVPDADGNSYSPYVLQHHQDALVGAWTNVHHAVLDPAGPDPFARANGGVRAYEFYGRDEAANELMRKAMWGVSVPFMEAFLDGYGGEGGGGFDGVEELVDVGGSSGACLSMIMRRLHGVKKGINFDLPEVVAGAPEFPGITHVGGDMFKSIPKGDAIFMKWVLTTWTDEECELILKNCYNALPEGGKVIACEPVLPEETDTSQRTRALLEGDIFVMTIYRAQGKERTEEEFRQIGLSAGFPNFRAIYLDHFYTVLELKK